VPVCSMSTSNRYCATCTGQRRYHLEHACGQHCTDAAEQCQLTVSAAVNWGLQHSPSCTPWTRNSTARQPWKHCLGDSHVRRNHACPCVHSITVNEKCTPFSRSEFSALLPRSMNGSAAEGREEKIGSCGVCYLLVSSQLAFIARLPLWHALCTSLTWPR